MTTGITLTDIDRLIASLQFNRVIPTRIEIRTTDDLDFSTENHWLVTQAMTIRGKQLIISPRMLPGSVRVLPEQKFSLCGMFSEWNVFDYGPVPSQVAMNGYLQFVNDTRTLHIGFPGEVEMMEEIRRENRGVTHRSIAGIWTDIRKEKKKEAVIAEASIENGMIRA